MNYACNNLKVKFSKSSYNHHASLDNYNHHFLLWWTLQLSQESSTQVDTLKMPQQDRLYHLLQDLGCLVYSNRHHWIQTFSSGAKSSFYKDNVFGSL